MPITLEQAKNLKYKQVLHLKSRFNADGTPQRWRVNGKVKTWKRSPNRVTVPIIHGLYVFAHLDETVLDDFDIADS